MTTKDLARELKIPNRVALYLVNSNIIEAEKIQGRYYISEVSFSKFGEEIKMWTLKIIRDNKKLDKFGEDYYGNI